MPNFTIYLPEREAAILNKMAEQENRSVSNTVSTLIRNSTVVSVATLPRPIDGQVVPVIIVQAES